ncbi:MAG: hypothetical protein SGI89_09955 [bacterium]|nr:hypothetical protein [bacterium]
MDSEIRVIKIEPQTTAVVRKQSLPGELSSSIITLLDEVHEFLNMDYDFKTGNNIVLYLDEIPTIEVGVIVEKKFEGNDKVLCSEIPAGIAAFVVHTGEYSELNQTHTTIREWCMRNNKKISGINWEIYGDWNDDIDLLKTAVYYQLEK